jgi:hypothetical protein
VTTHTTALRLDFHGTRLDLDVEDGAGIEGALDFLATHLTAEEAKPDETGRDPVATLRVHAFDPARLAPPAGTVPASTWSAPRRAAASSSTPPPG